MNGEEMRPQPEDYAVSIPITFDYKGGRAGNSKNKIIVTLVIVGIFLILTIGLFRNYELELWQKIIYEIIVAYVSLFLLRYLIFKELYFSDIYEKLKLTDFRLDETNIWQIFDIDANYPYISYFRNGQKGIFVRMEKDAISGKPDTAMYDHYEAISEAYNLAHSLNMNIVHIDYMDNVGNDNRLKTLYENLNDVSNPDMKNMLIDIYNNLQEEMSRNYASFDIYLFLTRDKVYNFLYNVQNVSNTMLGGNFITYKILDKDEISGVCTALFNLHDFSVFEACEKCLNKQHHHGIIPIKIIHPDGSETKLNDTVQEKEIKLKERQRKIEEEKLNRREQRRKETEAKKRKKAGIKEENTDSEILDLFDEDEDNKSIDLDKH